MNFDNLISAIIYLVCCYFLFWLGKLAYDLIHRDINVKEELVEITKDDFERKALEYFDFISWLESKIEGRVFAEVVREKAKISQKEATSPA